jgi:hypothetical protein
MDSIQALPANIRLDVKTFARVKHSSLLCLIFYCEYRRVYKIDCIDQRGGQIY